MIMGAGFPLAVDEPLVILLRFLPILIIKWASCENYISKIDMARLGLTHQNTTLEKLRKCLKIAKKL